MKNIKRIASGLVILSVLMLNVSLARADATTTDTNQTSDIVASTTTVTASDIPTACTESGVTMTSDEAVAAGQNGKLVIFFPNFGPTASTSIVRVVNQTGKDLPVSFISYKIIDNTLSNQQYFSGGEVTAVGGCATQDLSVAVPSCYAQVDIYYGAGPHTLSDSQSNGTTLYSTAYNSGCSCNTVGTPPPIVGTTTPPIESTSTPPIEATTTATSTPPVEATTTPSVESTTTSASPLPIESTTTPSTGVPISGVSGGGSSPGSASASFIPNRSGGGGHYFPGSNQGQVLGETYQPPPVVNGVRLSDVPYTGLDNNNKVIIFTLVLMAWSAIVVYFLYFRRRGAKLATVTGSRNNQVQRLVRRETLMSHDDLLSNLEGLARNKNTIISVDALEAVAISSDNNQRRAEGLLNSLVKQYANNEGFTVIDLKKVKSWID